MRKEYLELYRRTQTRPVENAADSGLRRGLRGREGTEREAGRQERAPQPPPRHILLDYGAVEKRFTRQVRFHALKGGADGGERLRFGCDPPRSFFGNIPFFREELANLLALGYRVYIFAEYPHQAERLRFLLKDLQVEVFPEGISRGFALPLLKILVIQENEIFGRKKRIPRSVATAKSQAIESFVDLSPGGLRGAPALRHRAVPGHRAHPGGRARAGLHQPGLRRRGEGVPAHRAGEPDPALRGPGRAQPQAGPPGRQGLAEQEGAGPSFRGGHGPPPGGVVRPAQRRSGFRLRPGHRLAERVRGPLPLPGDGGPAGGHRGGEAGHGEPAARWTA